MIAVEPRHPQILHYSRGESRSVVIALPAGESLQDHEVHDRAHVLIVDGVVEIASASSTVSGGAGTFVILDPKERHEVRAVTDARLLLVLAPWPGVGHPGARD